MQPVRRQTLIGQVTEQLREEILSGRWAIGARIPTEPELCELTGTSRNTIREAVQALVHAGMLERRQGSGTYVLSVGGSGSAIADYFAAANDRDLIELRQTLEVTAAGLAAPLITAAGLGPDRIALVTVAIGAGATVASHVNDTGFWLVKQYLGLTEAQTFRSWTIGATIAGLTSFGMALLLWPFV